MTISALIQINPAKVVKVFATDKPDRLDLPTGEQVGGAGIGWTGHGCALVGVTRFVVPEGQRAYGSAKYSVVNGAVVETFDTEAIPQPPAPTPVDPTLVSAREFRLLFRDEERAAITAAAQGNTGLRLFIDDAAAADLIHLSSDEVKAGIAQLVGAHLITQDRADAILSGKAPE